MQPPGSAERAKSGGGKRRRALSGALLAIVLMVLGAAWWLAEYAYAPGPAVVYPVATVVIPRGASGRDIGALLDEARLIEDDPRFVLLTRIMAVADRLPAGEFRLATNQTPVALITELTRAEPVQHRVTIPEGLTIEETAAIFARGGWADPRRFVALSEDRRFIAELGLAGRTSLEGYLFPDTYRLVRPAPDEAALLKKLVSRADDVWRGLDHGAGRFSRHEAVTLASIVEKETGQAGERPLIAAVFINRLERGMKLQSDPTVSYGVAGFTGPLSKADLARKTPYNTYQIAGLPPGPICSPGRAALQAVLTPAESDYLYFVSKNDGSHHFSRTLREHNRAVRAYQR